MPSSPLPSDSAIPVATTSQDTSDSATTRAKSKSPTNIPTTLPIQHTPETPEQQAAQDIENIAAVQQAQDVIDIDSSTDAHSAYGESGYGTDSLLSASTSLASSVRNYAWENGRRYHRYREGEYPFPNDDSEQEREDMKHAMMVKLCQTLHFAPIGPDPQNILDIGTGTGIWAIEMGDQYPAANILGMDLRGWFELQEIHHFPYCHDGSMPSTSKLIEFWTVLHSALAVLGVDMNVTLRLADMMREAGFTNVTTRTFTFPWALLKMVGLYWRTIVTDGLLPIAMGPMTRGLGWDREQVEVFLVDVRNALMDPQVHCHMPLHIICGQKPE
ncbi:Secondary metabolism regulator [Lachnellula occidentalis]|uniref:Secondary metabolism regulator n=1 Tax=Lachnellula occidentalis TaxID=215460 RepID=A0A8H8UBG6_9HELO|nr:Secondary metabolism regulator [Lachnellula occidentalis]